MQVTQTTSATGTSATAAQPDQAKPVISSDFQTFLLMLTTQMQNQDPLNPIESSDYATQLATFSGVEQQVRTNQLLESLATQLGLGGIAAYAGWVGKEVLTTAPVAFDGAPVTVAATPATGADRAVLVAYDAAGREAARTAVPVGTGATFDWVGTTATGAPLPSGAYTLQLESYSGSDLLSTSAAPAYASVQEVQSGASGVVLGLVGGSEVVVDAVLALRDPG